MTQGAVGGARHKFKKEPGVPNSDDEDGLEKDCDEIKVKSKACSEKSPSSLSNSARGKSSTCASEVMMKHPFDFVEYYSWVQSITAVPTTVIYF